MAAGLETREETLRLKVIEAVKRHKTSWVELGQSLYSVYKDKWYRGWGYVNFETYCAKELHLRQTTAVKLLRSYYFLEKEEPDCMKPRFAEASDPKAIPDFESVNLLRRAKDNPQLTEGDYGEVRRSVFEKGKEPKEIRAQVKKILSKQDSQDPIEAKKSHRSLLVKKMIAILSHAKEESEKEALLPSYLLKQIGDLLHKLQDQLE